jgi:hypothetical protein
VAPVARLSADMHDSDDPNSIFSEPINDGVRKNPDAHFTDIRSYERGGQRISADAIENSFDGPIELLTCSCSFSL